MQAESPSSYTDQKFSSPDALSSSLRIVEGQIGRHRVSTQFQVSVSIVISLRLLKSIETHHKSVKSLVVVGLRLIDGDSFLKQAHAMRLSLDSEQRSAGNERTPTKPGDDSAAIRR